MPNAEIILDVWQPKTLIKTQMSLRSFDNFAAFNAASADFHPTVAALGQLNADALQVRIKAPTSFVVCV